MPSTLGGLPLHPLVVHGTVIFVPLAAVLLLVAAVMAKVRRWAGILLPVTSLVALLFVFAASNTGENLASKMPSDPLIEKHAELADMMAWWSVPVLIFSILVWWIGRQADRAATPSDGSSAKPSGLVRALIAGLAVVAALGSMVWVALVGHAGAKAAWHDALPQSSTSQTTDQG